MSNERNAQLIRSFYDAVNRKDLETIASYGAPESGWLDVPFNVTSRGVRAIIDPWVSWFEIFPDATCEVRSLVALGDHVVAQGVGGGAHRGRSTLRLACCRRAGCAWNSSFATCIGSKMGRF
jgi:ketosteroid isomerase-like protein